MTTAGTTELLQGRASGLGKSFITARPPAAKIAHRWRVGIALVTAARAGIGALALADPLSVAARLSSPAALALFARPITAVGGPLPPATGSCTAGRTAITDERVPRLEDLLTTLQKTDATPQTPSDVLHQSRLSARLRWAHGESLAPSWSSLVAKRQLRSEAFLFLAAPPSCGCTNPPG